jgi:hypothetical protein
MGVKGVYSWGCLPTGGEGGSPSKQPTGGSGLTE